LAILAVQQIRRMRGGAQSHLMLGSDQQLYVVKFQNNPQHLRVLANELLGSRLAEAAGLSVPPSQIVEVSDWLIQNTPELCMSLGRSKERCYAGLQFGSRFVGGLLPGINMDYLPEEELLKVRNLTQFSGMLALDKWCCNANGRQAVFHKKARERCYTATFIDQGFCFNAGEWSFPDAPLRGVYARNCVYRHVTGWESFSPWLERMEAMEETRIWGLCGEVPPEWYGGDLSQMEELAERLIARRSRIREQIEGFQRSGREPFPNWGKKAESLEKKGFPAPEKASSLN
jgi:hypothetical protein